MGCVAGRMHDYLRRGRRRNNCGDGVCRSSGRFFLKSKRIWWPGQPLPPVQALEWLTGEKWQGQVARESLGREHLSHTRDRTGLAWGVWRDGDSCICGDRHGSGQCHANLFLGKKTFEYGGGLPDPRRKRPERTSSRMR